MSDQGRFPGTPVSSPPRFKGVVTRSLQLTLRDGVQLALDVNLPRNLPDGERLPAVLVMSRYWRSFDLRLSPPDRMPMGPREPLGDALVARGHAVVVVDVRGSGASSGTWPHPWSDVEVADLGEVARWVADQPWCNGHLGAVGISYEGTTAELLAAAAPERVRAVIPQQIEFDVYTDVVMPGGILNAGFMRQWDATNRMLDAGRVPSVWGLGARLMVRGVRPVDGDSDRSRVRAALESHRDNVDVWAAVQSMTFRDDSFGAQPVTTDDFSQFRRKEAIEASGATVYGWGSWFDGRTADAVIHRFLNFANPQVGVIGAWSHNMKTHASPFARPRSRPNPSMAGQWEECGAFFDRTLKSDAPAAEKLLHYFTVAEEAWKSTPVWPPAGYSTERWYFAADHRLVRDAPAGEGADTYEVDFAATTGTRNRWHTPDGMTPVVYGDRAREDQRLLTYTSAPLDVDVEITGHAILTLHVASSVEDGAFFVYLEEVDPRGRVTYLTEGQLRALHRRLSNSSPPYVTPVPYHSFRREDAWPLVPGEVATLTFGLLPISVLIRRGHRLRVALAGADADSFARIPAEGSPSWRVMRGPEHPSCIDLPVKRRG